MKKRVFSILLAVVITMGGISSYAFNLVPELPIGNPDLMLYDESFNDSQVNTTSGSPYWAFVGTETNLVYRTFENADDGGKAYKINNKSDVTAAQTMLYLPNLTASGKYVLQYNFKAEETNVRKLLAYTYNGTNKTYIAELKADGTFGIGNGGATSIAYQQGVWYNLFITYDLSVASNNVRVVIKNMQTGSVVLDKTATYAQTQITAVNIFVYPDATTLDTAMWLDDIKFYRYENAAKVEDFDDRAVVISTTSYPYWGFFGTDTNAIYRTFEPIEIGSNDYVYKINNQNIVGTTAQTSINTNDISSKPYLFEYDFKVSDNTTRKLLSYTVNGTSKQYVFELKADGTFAIQNGISTGIAYQADTWYKVSMLYNLTTTSGNNVAITVKNKATGDTVLKVGASYPETAITAFTFLVYTTSSTYSNTSLYLNNVSIKENIESPVPADTYIDPTEGNVTLPMFSTAADQDIVFKYNFANGLPSIAADSKGVSWKYTNLANAIAEKTITSDRGIALKNISNNDVLSCVTTIQFNSALTGRYVYEVDYMPLDTNEKKELFAVHNSVSGIKGNILTFLKDGNIRVGDSVVPQITYSANTWYKAYIIMNLNGAQSGLSTFQVILCDTATGNRLLEDKFDAEVGQVNYITQTSYGSAAMSNGFLMDNLKLYRIGEYMKNEYIIDSVFKNGSTQIPNLVNGTVVAVPQITNYTYSLKNGVIIAALYKSINGTVELQQMRTVEFSVNGLSSISKELTFTDITDAQDCSIKLFAWNSVSEIYPVTGLLSFK